MQQALARFQLGKWIWVAKDFLTAEIAEERGGRRQSGIKMTDEELAGCHAHTAGRWRDY
jgi:hypothetical protein